MPHVQLSPTDATVTGALKLLDGEQRDMVLEDAALEADGSFELSSSNGVVDKRAARLQATTRRLVWLSASQAQSGRSHDCSIPLTSIEDIHMSTGMMTYTGLAPKFSFRLCIDGSNKPTSSKGNDVRHRIKVYVTGSRSQIKAFKDRLELIVSRLPSTRPNDGVASHQIPVEAPLPEVDPGDLNSLLVMGYSRARGKAALALKGSVEQAAQWLISNERRTSAELTASARAGLASRSRPTHNPAESSGPSAPDHLVAHFLDMGYSADSAQRAHASTNSSDPVVCLNWHLNNPPPLASHPTRISYPNSVTATSSQEMPPLYPVPTFSAPNPAHASPYGAPPGVYGAPPGAPHAQQPRPPAPAPSAARVGTGLGGILAAKRGKVQQMGADVRDGFQDLEALKQSGQKLAALAADLRTRIAASKGKAPGETEEMEDVDAAIAQEMLELGIISPVTKTSAGRQYHEELSRELAGFLLKLLPKEGGMMALHDVYCLFNRARGLELVSPDDLRSAADSFTKLKLPVRLRIFPSGAAVVQDESWSDEAVCLGVIDVLSKPDPDVRYEWLGRGVSVMQFAVEANRSTAVATEQLLLAERSGFLCRDDGPDGLIFYRNIFAEL